METTEEKPKALIPIEKPSEKKPETPPEEKPEDRELRSKELMLKMGFSFVGSTMETLTDDSEMNLNDDEMEELIEVWKPFIPEMPPWVCAAIVTGVIFGKKGVLWRHKRKKKKPEKPEEKPKEKPKEGGKPTLKGL